VHSFRQCLDYFQFDRAWELRGTHPKAVPQRSGIR
jgi:hypothetical protein